MHGSISYDHKTHQHIASQSQNEDGCIYHRENNLHQLIFDEFSTEYGIFIGLITIFASIVRYYVTDGIILQSTRTRQNSIGNGAIHLEAMMLVK